MISTLYIEIKTLRTLSTSTLIEQLKQVFAIHGIPVSLISDNGPNYASVEFSKFSEAWDLQHLTSSPHHLKADGKAESAVKIMKSIITKKNKILPTMQGISIQTPKSSLQ